MAKFIDERQIVLNNVFEYEERLRSPIIQKTDRTLTPTTYYHLLDMETSVDQGLRNVEDNIGPNSGYRFHRIDDFPIGLNDDIRFQLESTEHGLDSSYEGEAQILPNTIRPVPNSYFIINYLQDYYLFRVTGIQYDNVRADNFYTITFKLEDIAEEKINQLNIQCTEYYDCILQNIGTEKNCIVQHETYTTIKKVTKIYNELANTYLTLFYSERYNTLLGPGPGNIKLYDPYLIRFANKKGLFRDMDVFRVVYLSEEITDQQFPLKYKKSVFAFIEHPDSKRIHNFVLEATPGIERIESPFYAWKDPFVYVTNVPSSKPKDGISIFSDSFLEEIENPNTKLDDTYAILLRSYIRKDPVTIFDINESLLDNLLTLEWNIELFYITPMILYIIQTAIDSAFKE